MAPNQFECAPMFEEANIAVDHNTLLMTIMRRVALRHKLRVLFHEKPFLGVNGSGKHCNWSLMTEYGRRICWPRARLRRTTFQFLGLLRQSRSRPRTSSASLFMASIATPVEFAPAGSHTKAPPAVMSVFAGSTLSAMLDSTRTAGSATKKMTPDEKPRSSSDIGKIPNILLDNTDRNRYLAFRVYRQPVRVPRDRLVEQLARRR
ncbi:MAG: hypothetical protein ACLTZY_03485 [Alistipes indistinctus]